MTPTESAQAAQALRDTLRAVDADEFEMTARQRAYLAGAIRALEAAADD